MLLQKPLLVRLALIIMVGGLLASLTLIPSVASAQSTTLNPVADGYVSASDPSTSFGTGPVLRVDSSPVANSYLRFNVAGLAGQKVTQALLKIYANSASTEGLVAKTVSDDNWGETTLNFSNAPAMGSTLSTSPAVSAGSWVTLDVTSFITKSGMYSFGVSTPGSTKISLAAREIRRQRASTDRHNQRFFHACSYKTSRAAYCHQDSRTTDCHQDSCTTYSYRQRTPPDKISQLYGGHIDERADPDLPRRQHQDEGRLAVVFQRLLPGPMGLRHQLCHRQRCCQRLRYHQPSL